MFLKLRHSLWNREPLSDQRSSLHWRFGLQARRTQTIAPEAPSHLKAAQDLTSRLLLCTGEQRIFLLLSRGSLLKQHGQYHYAHWPSPVIVLEPSVSNFEDLNRETHLQLSSVPEWPSGIKVRASLSWKNSSAHLFWRGFCWVKGMALLRSMKQVWVRSRLHSRLTKPSPSLLILPLLPIGSPTI